MINFRCWHVIFLQVTEDAVNGKAAPIFHYGQPASASESAAAPETSAASEPEAPVQRVAAAE